MADEDLENTGFLDDVVAYYPPLKSGFISIPVSDTAKYGWEKPFTPPPGNPVYKDDTADSKNQVLFQWKASKQEWVVKRGVKLEYGNIEFIQKFTTNGTPLKKPLIITFCGPVNRHMLGDDNFFYQENGKIEYRVPNPLRNFIYMKGKVLIQTPRPVIGACIRQLPSGKKWVIFATKHDDLSIGFYRYQVGKSESLEQFGSFKDNPATTIAGIVHFSDSGLKAVTHTRFSVYVDTAFFGEPYPESFDVLAAKRIEFQISYDEDIPVGVTSDSTITHSVSAGNGSDAGGTECGTNGSSNYKYVNFEQEIAAEYRGETLVTARVTSHFRITNGTQRSKSLIAINRLYEKFYEPWFITYIPSTASICSSGPGCACEGALCAYADSKYNILYSTYRRYMITRESKIDFVTYETSITAVGMNINNEKFGLRGTNNVHYEYGCFEIEYEEVDYPTPGCEIVGYTTRKDPILTFCDCARVTEKCQNQYGGSEWIPPLDDPIPPLPDDYSDTPTPARYLGVNVVLLDLKRGNYLIRKVTSGNGTGKIRGSMDNTTVNTDCFAVSNLMSNCFAQDVGYCYSFHAIPGTDTRGVFDGACATEDPELYPDDPLKLRFGYVVDGYDHVFCCASESYSEITGIMLYPVYAYLSQANPYELAQTVGTGARFKKIGVI